MRLINILLVLLISTSISIFSQTENKKFYRGSNYYNYESYPVYKASGDVGDYEGYVARKIIAGDNDFTDTVYNRPKPSSNSYGKYFANGWADWFDDDYQWVLPLLVKYGYSATFYTQIKPTSDNPDVSLYSPNNLVLANNSGSYSGDHCFLHFAAIYGFPNYDGLIPSNNSLTNRRSDGTNDLGNNTDSTLLSSLGIAVAATWMQLEDTTYNKKWSELTNEDCEIFRKNLTAFYVKQDPQNKQNVLQSLDYLSNKYCGTTGYSVKNGDYNSRLPNTIDSCYPTPSTRVLGGIFQGAATLQNQEIWERIQTIIKYQKINTQHIRNNLTYWATAGGGSNKTYYIPVDSSHLYLYSDSLHTKLVGGESRWYCSITGKTRSWIEVLESFGYVSTLSAQGSGFRNYSFNSNPKLERQRLYKYNSFNSKPNDLGDGFSNALRYFETTYTTNEMNAILNEPNTITAMYNYSDSSSGLTVNYKTLVGDIVKYTTWGLIPDGIGDSGTRADTSQACAALFYESVLDFCRQAGIKVISHEEAAYLAYNYVVENDINIFPNSEMINTIANVTLSDSATSYPDGWNDGVASGDTLIMINNSDSEKEYFTRIYITQFGNMTFTSNFSGKGTLNIYEIYNNSNYINTTNKNYSEVISINIDNSEFELITDTSHAVVNNKILEYSTPSNANEMSMQNYMKGYDNKICGFGISLFINPGDTLKMHSPSIIIN